MFDLATNMFLDAFFAAIAGLGFANVCNTPKKILPISALLAAFGHSCRWILIQNELAGIVVATFVSSLFIGIFSLFFAKAVKTPAEIISFPALLPMIPGVYAYKSILAIFSFITSDNIEEKTNFLVIFSENFLTATLISIALAVGVSVTFLIFKEEALMVTRYYKGFVFFHK